MAAAAPGGGLPRPRRGGRPALAVRVSAEGRWAVLVTVSGEVDLGTAVRLRELLERALDTGDPLALVVDMSEVDFLAAAGLSALVRVRDRAEARAVEFHVVADRRSVLRPMEITGLRPRFRVHPDLGSALARYASASSR
ncbi:STAS domain-containing protein [Actinokineospora spheciospongiae]|uniref:STAS domain-containing protein n=1 Tax=Actinokineospora spheciospongiae TaxID=909613 RepID=UPI000D70BCC9|nr:STAS domain-containing protein [Actinokineospora spheciospongiae]PWW51911.1 anti-anti-sigma factor [Actinokineospora spheciospongiae]